VKNATHEAAYRVISSSCLTGPYILCSTLLSNISGRDTNYHGHITTGKNFILCFIIFFTVVPCILMLSSLLLVQLMHN